MWAVPGGVRRVGEEVPAPGGCPVIANLLSFARMLWDELEAFREQIIEAIDPDDLWDEPTAGAR